VREVVSPDFLHQDQHVTSTARSLVALLLLMLCTWGFGAGAAQADPPIDVRGDITDNAGVLGGDTAKVQKALDNLTDKTGFQLFVVYVKSFDGQSGQDWSDASAAKSGLGKTDLLLAVATDDGKYGIAVPQEHALSDKDLDSVETKDIRPKLSKHDWSGAAIAAANGYAGKADDSGLPWGAIAIGGVVVVGGGALIATRIRRKPGRPEVELDEHGQPVDPLAALSTDELNKQASAALVSIDDALKTSEQELGFAEAQFGKEATRAFAEAIAAGHETAKAAFGLRQKLDDDVPETEPEKRQMTSEIIRLCTSVDEALDQHVAGFDELRDLQAKAPQVLEDVATRADEILTRVPNSRTVLTQLATTYPATSLTSVEKNADQAESLITAAKEQAALGTTALQTDDRATAVTHARAAEDAVAQAAKLLDAVDDADADLKAAPGKIAERLTSIQLDVADAGRLAPQDAGISAAAATATAAITYAQQAGNDPLAAEAALESGEAKLDELLAPVRAAAAEAEKARVALTESLGRITSRVKAVSDFIETRRGAVGAEARTRLSEAARHLDQAQKTLTSDPTASLAALQQSEAYVNEAEQLAQTDVSNWERSQQQSSGGGGGGLNSMVLGGILIDALGRGGGLGGILGGGSGGGGGGGGASPPARGPGSFGGTSTRGRRGGGGRF
jgi:hypothetical protein